MKKCIGLVLLALVVCACSAAEDPSSYPVIGDVIRMKAELDELIAPGAKIEVLASNFQWTEGPLWLPDEQGGRLIFSDIPANTILSWREGEGITVFMKPSGYTGISNYGNEPGSNGLALDRAGNILFCEHGDRRLSRLTPQGGKTTLADRYGAKRLHSPNDAVVKSNGDVYFTDPPYGLPRNWQDPRRELDFCGVYRYAADGTLTLLTRALARPNGLAFSPDEKTLYVGQSDAQQPILAAFPVREDGRLGPMRVFHDFADVWGKLPGAPDGLKVDCHGNLFATAPGGVYVITPGGTVLGRISTGERTANCAWGDDGSTLYMTADSYLCRIRTRTTGAGWHPR